MDNIQISDYDDGWPDSFLKEAAAVSEALRYQEVFAIEHFGSTAIPGLAAKPIIDILVAVPSVLDARRLFVPVLQRLEYVFWEDNPKTDRLFFVKGMPPNGERRTHHLHVAERPSEMWSRLKFRDYLRSHEDERDAYADLKRDLAAKHSEDREAYTTAKDEFVARIMSLATADE